MRLIDIKDNLPSPLFSVLEKDGVDVLRPCQEKAISAGLFQGKNLLVCTPTSSGKTLVGELAGISNFLKTHGKIIYVVPLKALASEKFKDFSERYNFLRVGLSIGDADSSDSFLDNCDFIVCTSEKLDSLIRHRVSWLGNVSVLIIDEVHNLNDSTRGPVLEVVITMMRSLVKNLQVIALSATIGNSDVLADWLNAELIVDDWRPVKLVHGILNENDLFLEE